MSVRTGIYHFEVSRTAMYRVRYVLAHTSTYRHVLPCTRYTGFQMLCLINRPTGTGPAMGRNSCCGFCGAGLSIIFSLFSFHLSTYPDTVTGTVSLDNHDKIANCHVQSLLKLETAKKRHQVQLRRRAGIPSSATVCCDSRPDALPADSDWVGPGRPGRRRPGARQLPFQ
jgi:hypothetical protein